MRRQTIQLPVVFLALFLSLANGQDRNSASNPDLFSDVPVAIRQRLKVRLQMMTDSQRAKDYQSLYGLMSSSTRQATRKESFVKIYETADQRELSVAFVEFQPTEVYSLYSDYYWMITGCGEYFTDKRTKQRLASQVEATYEKGDWYFSTGIRPDAGLGRDWKPCSDGLSVPTNTKN